MKRILPLALLASAAAIPASAAEIQIASQGPVVELTVTETAKAKPDAAVVTAGVTTRALQADAAARQNAERMEAIIARLKQIGVAREDVQTSNFSINPQFQYRNDGQQPTFIGYDVSNTVSVKLRNVAKIGPALDALIAAGANTVYGPNFLLENDKSAREDARKAAFASAQSRARSLAALAGYRDVRLLEVSETYAARPMMMTDVAETVAVSSAKATPIEPGLVGAAATLTVKYEMTR
ncbi:MAG: SIMPL domain-containing protein [Novosphingobium sp.]